MAKLIYSAIASLDGYVEDEQGKFDWAAPDPEVHAFVNDLERPIGTYLYGRRMYETMVFWEDVNTGIDQPAVTRRGSDSRSGAARSARKARLSDERFRRRPAGWSATPLATFRSSRSGPS